MQLHKLHLCILCVLRGCRYMAGQSPREIKRLLNNHRLMRVFMDVENILAELAPHKLVLWSFLCWRFGVEMQGLLPSSEAALVRLPRALTSSWHNKSHRAQHTCHAAPMHPAQLT